MKVNSQETKPELPKEKQTVLGLYVTAVEITSADIGSIRSS